MGAFQCGSAGILWHAGPGRRWKLAAIGCVKPDALFVTCHGEATLMDEAVVATTQQDKVLQTGGAAVGPMDDVMAVHVAVLGAAGEATAAIAQAQGTADGGWDLARFSAYVEDFPVETGVHDDLAAVAAQAPGGFRGNVWPSVDVTAQAMPVLWQGVGIHVNNHLVAFACGHSSRLVGKGCFGDP